MYTHIRTVFIVFMILLTISCSEQNSAESKEKKAHNYEKSSSLVVDNTPRAPVRAIGDISSDDIIIGDRSSSVVVIEYFSPTCPHCVIYHQKILPIIRKKYIDNKKIAYVFREFAANKQDLDAIILARCSGNIDTYQNLIEVLLSKQENWAYSRDYQNVLGSIGALSGISQQKFAACLQDKVLLNTIMSNTNVAYANSNFVGTPSFFINGVYFDKPYTAEELSKSIDALLNKD